jgi:hypothetical protein
MRAEALVALTVLDEHGAPVALGGLWRERPAVLAFVRHFGCLHCREHVVELGRQHAAIRGAGAELYVIGNGAPTFIAGFRDATGFAGPIYTDPSLAAYRAAHLERGLRTFVSLGAAVRTVGSFARGFRPGRVQGDNMQQGGVLVIARDGSIVWQHISKSPGDNAAPAEIVGALAHAR